MSVRPKTAKKVVEAYLETWKNEDWDRMGELMQYSYFASVERRGGFRYGPLMKLTAYSVISEKKISAVMRDVIVGLRFQHGNPDSKYAWRYRFRVIRERKRDGAPSRWGSWGVNPDSMRRIQ